MDDIATVWRKSNGQYDNLSYNDDFLSLPLYCIKWHAGRLFGNGLHCGTARRYNDPCKITVIFITIALGYAFRFLYLWIHDRLQKQSLLFKLGRTLAKSRPPSIWIQYIPLTTWTRYFIIRLNHTNQKCKIATVIERIISHYDYSTVKLLLIHHDSDDKIY